ncbi:MAG: ABC transporter substrate-binding protein [Dehalococcoidia bacterium]|nr:ABC transporter substrate-binding protein [Dehalococcoidia bacterium]
MPSQFWRQMRMMPTMPEQPYEAPWDDPRVRQAIVQAQDPQQILDLVYSGDGVVTNGPILPIYPDWALEEIPEGAEYDPAAAKALMEEAGNPNADGPLIWASTEATLDQVAEVHKQQLAEIGVNIELQPMELSAYYNQTYQYDYTYSSHTPLNAPDPDENLSSYFGRNSTYFKYAGPEHERIWDMIDEQATELDFERRQELVREVQRLIVQQFPMKFLYTTNLHEFTQPRVRNWFYSNGPVQRPHARGVDRPERVAAVQHLRTEARARPGPRLEHASRQAPQRAGTDRQRPLLNAGSGHSEWKLPGMAEAGSGAGRAAAFTPPVTEPGHGFAQELVVGLRRPAGAFRMVPPCDIAAFAVGPCLTIAHFWNGPVSSATGRTRDDCHGMHPRRNGFPMVRPRHVVECEESVNAGSLAVNTLPVRRTVNGTNRVCVPRQGAVCSWRKEWAVHRSTLQGRRQGVPLEDCQWP